LNERAIIRDGRRLPSAATRRRNSGPSGRFRFDMPHASIAAPEAANN